MVYNIQVTEEFPLLEADTRKRLIETKQAGKGVAGAVVSYKVWRLAIALVLLVVNECCV
jgi:hypothetical protein